MIPELQKVLRILAVIPATSCSAERSFSSLRRLKTYLRNTMTQERLSDLALLHFETSYVNQVISKDMDKMPAIFTLFFQPTNLYIDFTSQEELDLDSKFFFQKCPYFGKEGRWENEIKMSLI